MIIIMSLAIWAGKIDAYNGRKDFWHRVQDAGMVQSGEVGADGIWSVQVPDPNLTMTLPIFEWKDPSIRTARFQLSGDVRTQDVGVAYLEMWAIFPDGGRYFTRTLAEQGPMAQLRGSQDWRRFVLPFDSGDSGKRPSAIKLNLVVKGGGRVDLRPLQLSGTNPFASQLGLLGAVLGTGIGMLGSVVGILMGIGRARRSVTGLLVAMGGCGVIGLVAGIWSTQQPNGIPSSIPLLIVGVLALGLAILLFPVARKRYAAIEFRRMRAIDQS